MLDALVETISDLHDQVTKRVKKESERQTKIKGDDDSDDDDDSSEEDDDEEDDDAKPGRNSDAVSKASRKESMDDASDDNAADGDEENKEEMNDDALDFVDKPEGETNDGEDVDTKDNGGDEDDDDDSDDEPDFGTEFVSNLFFLFTVSD